MAPQLQHGARKKELKRMQKVLVIERVTVQTQSRRALGVSETMSKEEKCLSSHLLGPELGGSFASTSRPESSLLGQRLGWRERGGKGDFGN